MCKNGWTDRDISDVDLGGPKNCITWECTWRHLVNTTEQFSVFVWQRCGLISNYFDCMFKYAASNWPVICTASGALYGGPVIIKVQHTFPWVERKCRTGNGGRNQIKGERKLLENAGPKIWHIKSRTGTARSENTGPGNGGQTLLKNWKGRKMQDQKMEDQIESHLLRHSCQAQWLQV